MVGGNGKPTNTGSRMMGWIIFGFIFAIIGVYFEVFLEKKDGDNDEDSK